MVLQSRTGSDELLAFLDEFGVCGKQLHIAGFDASADGLNVVLSRENLHDAELFQRELKEQLGDSISQIDGLGAVSVIGAGINSSYANVRRGSAALRDVAINSRGLSTSSFRITWLMPDSVVHDAVRVLHRTFLEDSSLPVP
jgi:aspartate kinase